MIRLPEPSPRSPAFGAAACLALAVALVCLLWPCGRARGAEVANQFALAKCRLIVRECYPNSGFYPWCGTLLAEHEKRGNRDFAAHWWWSLVYGGADFGLRVGGIAPGNCAGPMDVKAWPLVLEPGANIRHHVAEAWLGYRLGYHERRNCEYVFLPSAPRDWGGGRFARTDARHRTVIARAYREGKLP
jgi:hypothetical protein